MIEIFEDRVVRDDFAPAQEAEPVPVMKRRDIECSGFDENKKCRPVPADQHDVSSKTHRKGRNLLRKYINRFFKICLLNLAAAITMLIIYKDTGNEYLVPAIFACVANGLLTYMCMD